MNQPLRTPPTYGIASVDHALRLATMLQLEGALSVSEAAARLGVARSTAHRLLVSLAYRDFAAQDADRTYRAGPVLELAAHSPSLTSRLRAAAPPALGRLVAELEESVNLTVRTGLTVRFIASVECSQTLRVGSREGMVFPAHRTSGGLVLLAGLEDREVSTLFEPDPHDEQSIDTAGRDRLMAEVRKVRAQGFAVNDGRSERGVVAVGVAIHDHSETAVAGLSLSMPTARYDRRRLPSLVRRLQHAAREVRAGLTQA